MKNKEMTPNIRFKGFTEPWEQRKLGDCIKWKKGSGLKKSKINHSEIGYPVVHYADLYKFNDVQNKVISWSKTNYGENIPHNSLLFPMSDVTPFGLARTSTLVEGNVFAGSDTLIGILNNSVNSKFLSYEINLKSQKILKFVTGTTIRHISSKNLSKLVVFVPCKDEQIKIYKLLLSIDKSIDANERQLFIKKSSKVTNLLLDYSLYYCLN